MSRTFWTPKGLQAARDLRYTQRLDSAILQAVNEAMARSRMAATFCRGARDVGLEMSPEDLEFNSYDDPAWPSTRVVDVRWRPQTTEVELLYGPRDGHVTSISAMDCQPYRAPIVVQSGMHVGELIFAAGSYGHFTTTRATYVAWGWNPEARRWVYIYEEKA